MRSYIDDQYVFFKNLDLSIRQKFIYRKGLRPSWYKKNHYKKINEKFPELKIDDQKTYHL